MYGSDRIMQRRFLIGGILFQSRDIYICNKVTKWRCGKHVFRPKIFLGEKPPKSDADILCPCGDTSVGKFGAIPPTDPDDISQSTRDFWPIFELQALKNCWGRPIPNEACISKRWSSSTNCEIFRGQSPLALDIWVSEKVHWVGRNAGPIFRRLWTKVHQIW